MTKSEKTFLTSLFIGGFGSACRGTAEFRERGHAEEPRCEVWSVRCNV
jgi:hypothetical protein